VGAGTVELVVGAGRVVVVRRGRVVVVTGRFGRVVVVVVGLGGRVLVTTTTLECQRTGVPAGGTTPVALAHRPLALPGPRVVK
jgi:hypothetical protein